MAVLIQESHRASMVAEFYPSQPVYAAREQEGEAGERRRVFCMSLGDFWDNQVPDGWRTEALGSSVSAAASTGCASARKGDPSLSDG
jgi:hypothetical protein